MLQVGGLYFPDLENHFTRFGDQVHDYQKRDREAAYPFVKSWRRALDVGANVGIFSRDFASRFDEVVAFEPIPRVRECLTLNVPQNVRVEPCAIADEVGTLSMYPTAKNSGGSFICNHPQVMTPEGVQLKANRAIEVEVRTIDSYDFDAVDLIKLDIQGAEFAALVGARETILRHKPVIMVEEKGFSEAHDEFIRKAADLLVSYGMTPKEKAQSDRIYVFEN
ncbi:FkbM family methyltransferase [Sphingomonas piscis]|uniref:FkbM family methyltransferase n=1 Tax=Sphingomonas piscis TaxID=2714943 RepID=A0A6G7YMW4_9SPHN|nr:FkbM family methyltransferase [Sphingomonas piscis]QIK78083.1 FkbM family methyltransferase [Sphingomonas piscis]